MMYFALVPKMVRGRSLIRTSGDYELMIGTKIRTTCTYFESAVYFTTIPLLNMKNGFSSSAH